MTPIVVEVGGFLYNTQTWESGWHFIALIPEALKIMSRHETVRHSIYSYMRQWGLSMVST